MTVKPRACASGTFVLLALAGRAQAIPNPGPPDFPMLGLTMLQTMRLNVLAPPNPIAPATPSAVL
jgi:hypothetical protein